MDLDSLLAPWTAQLHDLVPGMQLFDAHTHLGENDPDGMRQSPEELDAGLRQAGAVGAFTFPMHEPDGYPPANDMVIAAAAQSAEALIPVCSRISVIRRRMAALGDSRPVRSR